MSDLIDWELGRGGSRPSGSVDDDGAMSSAPISAASGSRAAAAVRGYTGLSRPSRFRSRNG